MQTAETMTATPTTLAELEAPVYLTCMEAAERVDSAPWPVIKLAREGRLGAVRYGALVLVSADAVDSRREELHGMVLASPEALAALEVPLQVINEARGTEHTVQSLADACGINLDEATRADVGSMARYIGGVLMA